MIMSALLHWCHNLFCIYIDTYFKLFDLIIYFISYVSLHMLNLPNSSARQLSYPLLR